MRSGSFPDYIIEQFADLLEYFGPSPIVVRSSSLLEDSFDCASAGKAASVFCMNQGSPEQRMDHPVGCLNHWPANRFFNRGCLSTPSVPA